MGLVAPPTADELRRALADVRAHSDRTALCAFALETLTSQAEGRSLLALGKLADKRAEQHGVTRESAQTELGNVLSVVEQSPQQGTEFALVSAYAIAGLNAALSQLDGAKRAERLDRFLEHAAWLELATAFRLTSLMDELLGAEHLALCHERTAVAVLKTDDGRDDDPNRRARAALRIGALSLARAESAKEALIAISSGARDPFVRGMADLGRGELPTSAPPMDPRIVGRVSTFSGRPAGTVLRVVTGWAFLRWVLGVLAWTLGIRRPMWIEVDASVLTVQRRVTFLGKTLRERRQVVRISEVLGATRHARFQSLHLVTGMVALGAGVITGVVVAADALRVNDQRLLTMAAAIASIGAGLDLLFEVLIPGRARAVTVDVALKGKPPVRISGISLVEADSWLRALGARLHGKPAEHTPTNSDRG